jgi:hypothetical protein
MILLYSSFSMPLGRMIPEECFSDGFKPLAGLPQCGSETQENCLMKLAYSTYRWLGTLGVKMAFTKLGKVVGCP